VLDIFYQFDVNHVNSAPTWKVKFFFKNSSLVLQEPPHASSRPTQESQLFPCESVGPSVSFSSLSRVSQFLINFYPSTIESFTHLISYIDAVNLRTRPWRLPLVFQAKTALTIQMAGPHGTLKPATTASGAMDVGFATS
jgi:hypothetical protein